MKGAVADTVSVNGDHEQGAPTAHYIWQDLQWLRGKRRQFRIARAMQRILSPRRIIASSLTVFFVVAYLLNRCLPIVSTSAS